MSTTAAGLSTATVRRIERAAGGAATRAVALMDAKLPWFRTLPAAQRSAVTLVAQAGISGYVDWLAAGEAARGPGGAAVPSVGSMFGQAPRELVRWVSLRRTVELVRVAISVAEELFPALAADPDEASAVTLSLLRYSREVAFSAAAIYAAAAESRGAWDQRLEALVVDALVRGENDDSLASRAAALDWDLTRPVVVLVGNPPDGDARSIVADALGVPTRDGRWLLLGQHRGRLIVVVTAGDADELEVAATAAVAAFGAGPVVRGPTGVGLPGAIRSARDALSGMRAVVAWPQAPRGVPAARLLPERALAGDADALEELRSTVHAPLQAAGDTLLRTLDAYLDRGGALEPTARDLYVHVNTVRYRLRRVAELTGLDPWVSRDAATLRAALTAGRLATGG
ncbi:PucR family transcriptional regulator [Nakamurella endophytica]|uniref:PucR family transcriptional regulator n=1 Tax=Nakamurella endophytica TaxID=1748367 RepID=A0A917T055_9ACTN|nr:helix-turn-helix domain-containing protein [Nakamurella endophytica]GGM06126.1 PucR family transcriptional regulator [Nakamurella endophytica]